MRTCQDCGKAIQYGVGFGGGGVCPSCRGKRASDSRRRLAELRGTPFAGKKHRAVGKGYEEAGR
jgi:hypothetical protein